MQGFFVEEFVGLRHTVQSAAQLRGIGLHTGAPVTLTLLPAPAGSGLTVIRTDLPERPRIPLRFDAVTRTALGTTVAGPSGAEINTVEHVCAALAACNVDDVIMEVNGPEMPIADGSAAPFVRLIRRAGLQTLNAPRRRLRVIAPVEVQLGDKRAALLPAEKTVFEFTVAFAHPSIGVQSRRAVLSEGGFRRHIARARTFGFSAEAEMLQKAGLARGASCANAVVFDAAGVRNPEGLRYDDECVRHKILDAVGDLSLAGAPIVGRYVGHKAGHDLNNRLLRALLAEKPAATVAPRVPAPVHAPALLYA